MAVTLDGGCRVALPEETEPLLGEALLLRKRRLAGGVLLDHEHDQMLYILEGEGRAGGQPVGPNTGIYVPAGTTLPIEGSLAVAIALTPAEHRPDAEVEIVQLADCPPHTTGDRFYHELISARVTQFVGVIPPGRAPDHYHHYEEVLVILTGTGRMWTGKRHTPLDVGSCVYLPRGQVHCVENTGSSELRLLGVFYPAGSPAARYET